MRMNQLEVLTKDEIELIHNSTLELLNFIGVKVESEDARDLLKKYGCIIDESNKNHFVKFPEKLVKEKLKSVPDHFSLWGPDGTFHLEIDTKTINFATVGTPVKIYDPESKTELRKTILADTINQIRIVDSLKNIHSSHIDVWPHDIPFTEIHCHCLREWAKNSRKPYGIGCFGKLASQDMMNIASIIVGGDEELKKRPRLIGFFNPTSPLNLTKIHLNGAFVFAKYNQPLIIAPAASGGATAPVTLAGLLVQTNMETLSSIVITQLINSGTPILYSSMSAPMDPPTGNVAWGSIETGLITAAWAQLGKFYKIPSRGPGCVTDSKCFDLQNGYERLMTLFFAASAGINYITCAGTYESSLSEALELLVIDDELCDIVKRGLEGVNVDEDSLALDEIKRIAETGKNYLGTKHSVKNIRKELYVPKLGNRSRRESWKKEGSKDIITCASEKVKKILLTQKGPGLTPEVERKLEEYTKKVALRSMDDYRKAEGIEKDATSVLKEIKKED